MNHKKGELQHGYYVEIFMHVDKSYLSQFSSRLTVLNLSLWKYSFELINKELEVTRKKKQALDDLFMEKKISQSTYDYLKAELTKAISELENDLKRLKERMMTRAQELESQLSSLELLLASLEIHHAAGDVDDETYEKENKAILLGLEATKQELNDIRNSLQGPSAKAIEEPVEIEETTAEETEAVETEEPAAEAEQTVTSYVEPQTEKQEEHGTIEESTESTTVSPESESSESPVEESSSTYYSDEPSNVSSWDTESSTEY